VTAAICTKDRPDLIATAVESVLRCDHPEFELIVVDQSTDGDTERALSAWRHDERLSYVKTSTIGLGASRNVALRAARFNVVAFTDDDCVVPTDWLTEMVKPFTTSSRTMVVFCNVVAGPHNPSLGFVPDYLDSRNTPIDSILAKLKARGIGAGMAVRRDSALSIGGFDGALGAGARFSSCEDRDIAVRAILTGYVVFETDAVSVVHHGFRTFEEGKALTRRDWVGIGAACSKPVKCRRWGALAIAAYEGIFIGFIKPLSLVFRGRRPQGIRRIKYFGRGFVAGLREPVDCATLLFETAPDEPISGGG
jgi:glycosyltransferase involved in cell wall biosynthesis